MTVKYILSCSGVPISRLEMYLWEMWDGEHLACIEWVISRSAQTKIWIHPIHREKLDISSVTNHTPAWPRAFHLVTMRGIYTLSKSYVYHLINIKWKTLFKRVFVSDWSDKPLHTATISYTLYMCHGALYCMCLQAYHILNTAFGLDRVFRQSGMRKHLLKYLESKKMEPFPVQSRERRLSTVPKVTQIQVHCYCRCPDDGNKMIACDGDGGELFHTKWLYINCYPLSLVRGEIPGCPLY